MDVPVKKVPIWNTTFSLSEFTDTFDPAQFLAKYRNQVASLVTLQAELHEFLETLQFEVLSIVNEDYNHFIQFSSQLVTVQQQLVTVRKDLPHLYHNVETFYRMLCSVLGQCRSRWRAQQQAKIKKHHALLLMRLLSHIRNLETGLTAYLETEPSITAASSADSAATSVTDAVDGYLAIVKMAEQFRNVRSVLKSAADIETKLKAVDTSESAHESNQEPESTASDANDKSQRENTKRHVHRINLLHERCKKRLEAFQFKFEDTVEKLLFDTLQRSQQHRQIKQQQQTAQSANDSVQPTSNTKRGLDSLLGLIASGRKPTDEDVDVDTRNAATAETDSQPMSEEEKFAVILFVCLRALAICDKQQHIEQQLRIRFVKPILAEVLRDYRTPNAMDALIGERESDESEAENESEPVTSGAVSATSDTRLFFELLFAKLNRQLGVLLEASHAAQNVVNYNLLSHAIWPEVAETVNSQLSHIFAPGLPNIFLENYSHALRFIGRLERSRRFVTTGVQLAAFRDIAADFEKKWNLSVYFRIRKQEIAAALDTALEAAAATPRKSTAASETTPFTFAATAALWTGLRQCFAPQIFVYKLAESFIQLALQLMSRFHSWFAALYTSKTAPEEWRRMMSSQTEMAALYVDLDKLCTMIRTQLAKDVIPRALGIQQNTKAAEIITAAFEQKVTSAIESDGALQTLRSALQKQLIDSCVEVLSNLRGISLTYRMTGKPPPTKYSFFVPNILKSLRAFLETTAFKNATPQQKRDWCTPIIASITQRFVGMSDELITSAKKMAESIKKIKRSTSSLSNLTAADSSAAAPQQQLSDTDKMILQMYLDAEELGKQVNGLERDCFGSEGAHLLDEIPAYSDLIRLLQQQQQSADQ